MGAVAVVVAAALVVGAVLVVRNLGRHDARAETTGGAGGDLATTLPPGTAADTAGVPDQGTSATTPPPDLSHDQASQLNALLDESSNARDEVVSGVAAVASCGRVADGAQALATAVSDRQDVLQRLASLDASSLPNGAELVSLFGVAVQKSLEADQHFAAWAASIQGSGGCQGTAPHDSDYQAAAQASGAATGAKQEFLALWNPIATSEGLPTREEKNI